MDELFLHQIPADTEITTSIILLNFSDPYPQKSMFCSLSNHFTGVSKSSTILNTWSLGLCFITGNTKTCIGRTMQLNNVNRVFYFLYFSFFKYSKNVMNNV